MPQEDDEAAELDHAEEIGLMIFPAANQSAEVVEPGKEPLDFPAAAVPAQFAAVLSVFAAANVLVRRDQSNAVFSPQTLVERVAVVGTVTDHSLRFGSRETVLDGALDKLRFMR